MIIFEAEATAGVDGWVGGGRLITKKNEVRGGGRNI